MYRLLGDVTIGRSAYATRRNTLTVPSSHGLATSRSHLNAAPSEQPSKPNLRQASGSLANSRVIVACVVAVLFMYPMIFRPMFRIGMSDDEEADNLDAIKKKRAELDKHRPSFMPEWSSPFGPRPGEDK